MAFSLQTTLFGTIGCVGRSEEFSAQQLPVTLARFETRQFEGGSG
jgi:hypothetical protein